MPTNTRRVVFVLCSHHMARRQGLSGLHLSALPGPSSLRLAEAAQNTQNPLLDEGLQLTQTARANKRLKGQRIKPKGLIRPQ